MSTTFRVRLQEAGGEVFKDLRSFLLLIFTVLEVNLACVDEQRRLGCREVFL